MGEERHGQDVPRCHAALHAAYRSMPGLTCGGPAVGQLDGVWLCRTHLRQRRYRQRQRQVVAALTPPPVPLPAAALTPRCRAARPNGTPCGARATKLRDGQPVCIRHSRWQQFDDAL